MPFRSGPKVSEVKKERRRVLLEAIEEARLRSRMVRRDGRTYRLVRLPDAYPKIGPTGGYALREDQVDALDRGE